MKVADFRWNEWNLDHATKHGCRIPEIESVVRREANRARKIGDDKLRVEGRGVGDRFIEVIFVVDADGETVYVIHAMPLTTRRRKGRR